MAKVFPPKVQLKRFHLKIAFDHLQLPFKLIDIFKKELKSLSIKLFPVFYSVLPHHKNHQSQGIQPLIRLVLTLQESFILQFLLHWAGWSIKVSFCSLLLHLQMLSMKILQVLKIYSQFGSIDVNKGWCRYPPYEDASCWDKHYHYDSLLWFELKHPFHHN